MKSLLFFFLIFVTAIESQAQKNDYLITRNHDTLYGNVREYGVLSKRCDLTVGSGKHKKRFHYNEVLEWRNGPHTHMMLHYTNEKGKETYMQLMVFIYGDMRLLSDLLSECSKCYVYLEGKFIFMSYENLEKVIWPTMLKNEKFAKMYGNVPIEEVKQWPRQIAITTSFDSAVMYYNQK